MAPPGRGGAEPPQEEVSRGFAGPQSAFTGAMQVGKAKEYQDARFEVVAGLVGVADHGRGSGCGGLPVL